MKHRKSRPPKSTAGTPASKADPQRGDSPPDGLRQGSRATEGVEAANKTPAPEPPKNIPLNIPAILMEGDAPSAAQVSGPGQKFASVQDPRVDTTKVREKQGSPAAPPQLVPASEESGARASAFASPAQLPETYGTGRLLLVARDPHHLYTHWDVSTNQLQAAGGTGQQHLALRMHLTVANGPIARELQVRPESRHWFVRVEREDTTYIAELGYYGAQHEWHPLATSKPATTPRGRPAEEQRFQVATFGATEQTSAALSALETQADYRSQPAAPKTGRRRLVAPKGLQWPVPGGGQQDEPAIRPEAPRTAQLAPGLPSPAQELAEGPGSEWTSSQEQFLAQFTGISLERQETIGSLEIMEMLEQERMRALFSPGIPEAEAISSLPGLPEAQARDFWFNINAELVIYGATEPNARVSVNGRAIRLRSDGSFALRFALPDGHYVLPIAASSAEGETRRAELSFRRSTNYCGDVGLHPQDPALKEPLAQNAGG